MRVIGYPRTSGMRIAFLLAILCATAAGRTYYVDGEATSPGSGTRADPFRSIQQGIDAASRGDEVRVAPGTYDENIRLKSGVKVYGGAGLTVIDGGARGSVVTAIGVDAAARLDGFTITNGDAEKGGGMYCEGSSPTVADCIFARNTANDCGGGMFNTDSSSPTVIRCTFENNNSRHGAGMGNLFSSSPTVTECTFRDNVAYDTDDGHPVFAYGGGMVNTTDSSPRVTDCAFVGNSAGYGGGGIANNGSSPRVTNCIFEDNRAINFYGGGMDNQGGASPTVVNCIFWNNRAFEGGAMGNFADSSPRVFNCTFYGNVPTRTSGVCGGIYNQLESSPWVLNCILWGDVRDEIRSDPDCAPRVQYCDIEGGYPGEGNKDEDPRMEDPSNGDFHLQGDSCCIDAGDIKPPTLPPTDYEGDPRMLDGDGDGEEIVDIGADEYVPPTIADSGRDWPGSGIQGARRWFFGYYNRGRDSNKSYDPEDFTPFGEDSWRKDAWRLVPSGAPWTHVAKGEIHPNGPNSGEEHWSIRRWVSGYDGEVALTWHMRKTNLHGTGVTGYLFINGREIDRATIAGGDHIGVTRTRICMISVGDEIDLALSPEGVCGDLNDGNDGSFNSLRIRTRIPPGLSRIPPGVVADSMADWSVDGVQGENGWTYGYYDLREDLKAGDGVYGAGDFIKFSNKLGPAGGLVNPLGNHWSGAKWHLLDNAAAGRGPWTEINCGGGHPAGNGQTDRAVHWAVRRWVSEVAGKVDLRGCLWNMSGEGDGVIGRVFQNGKEIHAARSDEEAVRFVVSVGLAVGDSLDFAIDPDGAGNLAAKGIDAIDDTADSTTFLITITQYGGGFVRGDANADKSVDIADAISTLSYLFAGGPMPCVDASDINDDGKSDIADPVALLSYLFAQQKPPAAPFDTCGFDPTDDALGCASFPPCAQE